MLTKAITVIINNSIKLTVNIKHINIRITGLNITHFNTLHAVAVAITFISWIQYWILVHTVLNITIFISLNTITFRFNCAVTPVIIIHMTVSFRRNIIWEFSHNLGGSNNIHIRHWGSTSCLNILFISVNVDKY